MAERRTTAAALLVGLLALGLQAGPGPALAAGPTPARAPAPLIDINSASRAQLKTLPGIGDAEADRIVAARPYLSKADLASKQVIPTGIYLSLKNRIIAKQTGQPLRRT